MRIMREAREGKEKKARVEEEMGVVREVKDRGTQKRRLPLGMSWEESVKHLMVQTQLSHTTMICLSIESQLN